MGNMTRRLYGLTSFTKMIAMASFDNTDKMSIPRCIPNTKFQKFWSYLAKRVFLAKNDPGTYENTWEHILKSSLAHC